MRKRDELVTNILLENRRRERSLSKWACGSRKAQRLEYGPLDVDDIRPAFARDTDRIIHSRAYTRYIDKTQVFYLFENDHITHRVLHVQLVSKIGRTIGRALRLNEDLIEAIALGHDLGHVPYGHDGEQILNTICLEHQIGGFAHNVQSVRWLMDLERNGKGLNLSLQVLDGILAHDGEMLHPKYAPQYDKTWDDFNEEYRSCLLDPEQCRKIYPMTLEGCVVRISDVIAYIGRDIEDAVTLGLITWDDVPTEITGVLGKSNREMINTLIMDLIRNSYDNNQIEFSEDVFTALNHLKAFNYEHIYHNPTLKSESHKIERMFKDLSRVYLEDLTNKQQDSVLYRGFLNNMDLDYMENTRPERIVIDFIAGMTDDFFNNQFKEMFVPRSLGYKINR
jgi:dGTPase